MFGFGNIRNRVSNCGLSCFTLQSKCISDTFNLRIVIFSLKDFPDLNNVIQLSYLKHVKFLLVFNESSGSLSKGFFSPRAIFQLDIVDY
jgi:hypothetical protein